MSRSIVFVSLSLVIGLGVGYRIGSRPQVPHSTEQNTEDEVSVEDSNNPISPTKSSRSPASIDGNLTEEQQVLKELVSDNSCDQYLEQKKEEQWQADLAEAKELVQRPSNQEDLIQEQIQKDLDSLHLDLGNSSNE